MANPFIAGSAADTAASTSRVLSVTSATSAGDTLLLLLSCSSRTVSAVTDSQSNVYTLDTSSSSNPQTYFYRSPGATGGSGGTPTAALSTSDTVTVTVSATGNLVDMVLVCAPGVGALDAQSATRNGSAASTISVSATPTVDGDYGICAAGTSLTETIGSPFTTLGSATGSGPFALTGYNIFGAGTGGSSQSATFNWSGTSSYRTKLWLFLAPAGNTTANAGLASGTGAAQQPALSLTVNAGLAAGTGTAQQPAALVKPNAGLATGTGAAQQPAVLIKPAAGLASGTGSALSPPAQVTAFAGLASGTGSAFQAGIAFTPALSSGTGAAQHPSISLTAKAGLATGTGTAQQPTASITVNAGLASGTGSAFQPSVTTSGSTTASAGLASGTGAAQQPSISVLVNAGFAAGTGTSQQPVVLIKPAAGLASGTGTAWNASVTVGSRANVDYRGSTLSIGALSGTLAVTSDTMTGTIIVSPNNLGGTITPVNTLGGTCGLANVFGGTLSVTSDTLTGTLSVTANNLSSTEVTDKMQEVDITLNEFNDATVTFQIKNNGSPMDITGMTVNALFKKTRGDLDSAGTTKTYSSGGGSPAITINTPSTGSCTLAIPDGDVTSATVWSFYRIDVVSGTVTTTAIFGVVTITTL